MLSHSIFLRSSFFPLLSSLFLVPSFFFPQPQPQLLNLALYCSPLSSAPPAQISSTFVQRAERTAALLPLIAPSFVRPFSSWPKALGSEHHRFKKNINSSEIISSA
jgi:hypothetical protein